MRRTASIVLALGAGAIMIAPAAIAAQHADTRQRVAVPAAGRDTILAEMRHMLESVHAIVRGLESGDFAAVETAARASGMQTAADVQPEIRRTLPPAFLSLGMQTHKAFDALADAVNARPSRDVALERLGAVTSNCVACHAAYRLDEAR
jgi:cytochrome c556